MTLCAGSGGKLFQLSNTQPNEPEGKCFCGVLFGVEEAPLTRAAANEGLEFGLKMSSPRKMRKSRSTECFQLSPQPECLFMDPGKES